jgi:hypothetical protein
MLLWIESQSTPVIALLVFGFCYAATAVIFVGAAILSSRGIAADLKATSPVTLTPLAVVLGLLIAFLASRSLPRCPIETAITCTGLKVPSKNTNGS